MGIWRKKMKRLVYWRYVLHRILAAAESRLSALLDALIRCIHAAPKWPNGKPGYGLDDLAATSKANGTELFITRDIHSADAFDLQKSRHT